MSRKLRVLATTLCLVLVAAACSPDVAPATAQDPTALPNPVSVYCENQGGRFDLRTDASGGQSGVCFFPDGSECDEWAFYRQLCAPGQSLTPGPAGTTTAAVPMSWLTFSHAGLGYSFDYPQGSTIETEDASRYVNVIGPIVYGEHWPVFGVTHSDEADYRLPASADLETWLRDHYHLLGTVADARTIGGQTALHIRHNNSAQSYNDDRYYFAHEGRIFEITILHSGTEDWRVYNRFLDSFRFE